MEFDYDCVGMVKMGLSEYIYIYIPPKFNGPLPFSPLKSTVRGIPHFRQTQIPLGKFNIAMEHILENGHVSQVVNHQPKVHFP